MLKYIKSIQNHNKTKKKTSPANSNRSANNMSAKPNEHGDVAAQITQKGNNATAASSKTPHDQNENEVIILELPSTEAISTNTDSDDLIIIPDTPRPVIDLTQNSFSASDESLVRCEENECIFEIMTVSNHLEVSTGNSSKESESNFTEMYVLEDNDVSFTVETSSSGNKLANAKPDSPVKLIEDIERALSDTEEQEDGSKSEMLDTSLESNEVIILEETDQNEMTNDPLHDPLAIDDYSADISSNITLAGANIGSSDTSTEGELIFTIDSAPILLSEPTGKPSSKPAQRSRRSDNFATTAIAEEANTEEQEVRSDGSDSGLGSETSTLQSANASLVVDPPVFKPPPEKGNLKRHSDGLTEGSADKRSKKSINFNGVKVYYFPRIQGFGCIPSQGGCTLGMAPRHVNSRTFSLADYTAEQRRVHKQQMQETNPRASSSDDTDSDEEVSEASGSDLDADASGFLQPVPARQRRAILKAAGIRKIDSAEKDECRAIRSSREFCGCSCRGYCDPDTCSCSQTGIKCQVDRPNFPCGCTRDGCANVVGRVEFNPSRVRTHYIHTIMRLDIENKQKRALDMEPASTSASILSYAGNSSVSSSLSLCSYNTLVNANHLRQHQQIHSTAITDCSNQISYLSSGGGIFPNRTSSIMLPTRLIDTDSVVSTANDNVNMSLQTPTTPNQDIDLHYAFRDDSSSEISPQNNSNNILGLSDYTPSNALYHEVYNSHSFLGQSYPNANFCQSQNVHYQNFINYQGPVQSSSDMVQPNAQSAGDVTSKEILVTDSSYIDLNTPAGYESRVNAINDLLHNSRNLAAINSAMPSLSLDAMTTITYNMAPSAQTSTSITEGTQTTTTQPQMSKPTTSLTSIHADHITPEEMKSGKESESTAILETVVDLTDRATPQGEKIEKDINKEAVVDLTDRITPQGEKIEQDINTESVVDLTDRITPSGQEGLTKQSNESSTQCHQKVVDLTDRNPSIEESSNHHEKLATAGNAIRISDTADEGRIDVFSIELSAKEDDISEVPMSNYVCKTTADSPSDVENPVAGSTCPSPDISIVTTTTSTSASTVASADDNLMVETALA